MEVSYLAIDVGGTYIKHGIVSSSGIISQQDKVKTPQKIKAFKAAIFAIVDLFKDMVSGVAVSAPGRVVTNSGTIYLGGSLPFLDGFSVKEFIEANFNLPCTAINDGKAAAQAEFWLGNLVHTKNSAAILLGTGVGGGLIINGELSQGSHFQAGELSYIMRSPQELSDESTIGRSGSIVRFINKAGSMLALEDQGDGKAVFKALETGEHSAVTDLFNDYCHEIVFVINQLQVILDIEKVVIGGGASAQPLLLQTIKDVYDSVRDKMPWFKQSFQPLEIDVCQFGSEANLLGAVYELKKDLEVE